MDNDLFVPATTIDPNKDYSTELVGEGKKFSDVPALARGKVESDLHIQRLEREAQELREDLAKRATIEEAVKRLQTTAQTTTQQDGNSPDSGHDLKAQISPEEISKLVQSEMSRQSIQQSAKTNVDLVKSELTKAWGNDYATKLAAKAVELGVTQDYITEQARTYPKVLLTLLNVTPVQEKKSDNSSLFSPSQGGINTAALSRGSNAPQEESYAYWQKVRKDDPKYYHSVEGAKLRHAAAQKLGPAFYG